MVLDRLFLWIFTIACLVGTCGIILQVCLTRPLDHSSLINDYPSLGSIFVRRKNPNRLATVQPDNRSMMAFSPPITRVIYQRTLRLLQLSHGSIDLPLSLPSSTWTKESVNRWKKPYASSWLCAKLRANTDEKRENCSCCSAAHLFVCFALVITLRVAGKVNVPSICMSLGCG